RFGRERKCSSGAVIPISFRGSNSADVTIRRPTPGQLLLRQASRFRDTFIQPFGQERKWWSGADRILTGVSINQMESVITTTVDATTRRLIPGDRPHLRMRLKHSQIKPASGRARKRLS